MNTHKHASTSGFAQDLFLGQHVFTSGRSSGISLEIARGFRNLGAHMVATGSSEQKLTHDRAEDGNTGIVFTRADLRDHAGPERLIGSLEVALHQSLRIIAVLILSRALCENTL